jgi:hypothetical protein
MKKAMSLILISVFIAGCQFSKSVKKDLISGLATKGDGLSCDVVYLSVNDIRTESNSFIYGQKLNVVFNDIKGFKMENSKSFPDMDIVVTTLNGDTILHEKDLYAEFPDGLSFSPLQLKGSVTIASPIHSGGEYFLFIFIKDKKGTGTFSSKLKFTVRKDDRIKVESTNVTYNEIYLFSRSKDAVITDGKINYNDEVYIIAEGLSGFKEENNSVFPGLSLSGTDASGIKIFNYSDLFADYNNKGLTSSDFNSRVSVHFKIILSGLKNPFHTVLNMWDKKSGSRLIATTDLDVE